MSNSILPIIEERWSPRAFSSKSISKEDLNLLFKAAGKAASCFNEQPWRFVYAGKEDTENFDRLVSCLTEFNQVWAKNAAVLVATLAKKNFEQTGEPNKHSWHDVGLAMGNMSLQAMSMDIYLHHMAGYESEKAIEKLDIPTDFEPVSFVAIGHLGDKEQLPNDLKEKESPKSPRKDLDEITFVGKMGK
ncbi:nitroreductase family protein [Bernardetia sp. MNP-M8]|uniref:nitroreductase family protein n=1 Tax=Bernardetia sp. MNP-M8 TaxID=3127470 RepID=UPI0030D49E91